MRLVLTSMALGLSLGIGALQNFAPSQHAAMHLDRVEGFDSDGGTCPSAPSYCTVTVRGWETTDAGPYSDQPRLPPGFIVLREVDAGLCGVSPLCVAGDGGVDPTASATPDCACAVDATCTLTVDGGAAPHGVTLWAGTWSGAGCVAKACVALFVGDGGDGTWPSQCPLQ